MKPEGRVLVIDQLMGSEDFFRAVLDLQMLVEQRGPERTEAEFRTLDEAAGLQFMSHKKSIVCSAIPWSDSSAARIT